MKLIPLNKGKFAIVDDEDFDHLNQFKWFAWKRQGQDLWYAVRSTPRSKWETSVDRKMDRHIIQIPEGFLVDHKNGNGLDYQKENLRLATYQQNSWNSNKSSHKKSSKYKGVSLVRDKWQSGISVGGKRIYLGRHISEEAAALAYDMAAIEHFGEFARPNILTVLKESST